MTLAARTANQPRLNFAQLAEARLLATVRLEDPAGGQCLLIENWTARPLPREFIVTNCDAVRAVSAGEYILPLEPDTLAGQDHYRIVGESNGTPPLLAYPNTESVREQLQGWLRGQN
ncbi:MAG: hypothetical protein R3B90_02505 [Planctomycetaceae bacterium]